MKIKSGFKINNLHEHTEVKFKIAGNTGEVQFLARVNKKCPLTSIYGNAVVSYQYDDYGVRK